MAVFKEQFSDLVKRATALTIKAIAQKKNLEVAFRATATAPAPLPAAASGVGSNSARMGQEPVERVILLTETPDQPEQDLTLLRAEADSAALRLRYHDKNLHRRLAPTDMLARQAFDAMEQARCEAIGACHMLGTAHNIMTARDQHWRDCGYDHAKMRSDVPLPEALQALVFHQLTNLPPSVATTAALSLWQEKMQQLQDHPLAHISGLMHDQAAYAGAIKQFLRQLELPVPDDIPPPDDTEGTMSEADTPPPDPSEESGKETPTEDSGEDADTGPPQDDDQTVGQDEQQADQEQGSAEPDQNGETSQRAGAGETEAISDDGPVTTYRAYTRAHDEIVHAHSLAAPEELARLRQMLDRQLRHMQGLIVRLANRLQRRLMAQQTRRWEFDMEDGILDTARLARIVASPSHTLSYKVEKPLEFRDTVVTLLLDNSGSMRGRPITLAALSADILARTLERCGVKTEILGFTTRAWKGGLSRDQWIKDGKPVLPGRLNDLRHIIYKAADEPWRRARQNLGLLLREGLLKENIDGEALLWAYERLRTRPEQRRILMVISDGAPVDDATLSANPGHYLEAHLRAVIDWIEARRQVELVAIGIGHDVTRYYRRAVTISDSEELGSVMMEQLAQLFEPARR